MHEPRSDAEDSRPRGSPPPLLQVFNRYLAPGGEEFASQLYSRILSQAGSFGECVFESAEWTAADAPPRWKQAALTFYNPDAVRRLRERQRQIQARAWIVHNVLPVGSTGIYTEAARQKIPIIQSINNFRPFCVSGYNWVGRQMDSTCWPRNFMRETIHGTWQNSRWKTAFMAAVLASMHLRRQFQAVRAWIAITGFMRREFISAGVPEDRVFRLYYPWVVKNAAPEFREDQYYLFLGRLIEEKGIKILVNAWDILAGKMGSRTPRLRVAGEGPMGDWVRAAQKRNPHIEFSGFVGGQAKHELIAACRAIVQPAIWAEPLSLVIYEAFDYGKPVLAAASGGMPELVESGGGLIHRPGDAAHLADQVLELEGFPSGKRREMGRIGREWLLANTDPEAWKRQLYDIVENTIQREKQE